MLAEWTCVLLLLTALAPQMKAGLADADAKTFHPEQWRLDKPPYPFKARATHEEGHMTVAIVTDAKGLVTKATVFSDVPHPILDAWTAVWACEHWHGPPNSKAKVPVRYVLS